jgi:hypothetical protein
MLCPFPLSFYHLNNVWWRVDIMNHFTVQCSSWSCCLLPLWSSYSPQHSVLRHNLFSSLNVRDQVSCPYKTMGKQFHLYVLDRVQEDKQFWTQGKLCHPKGWTQIEDAEEHTEPMRGGGSSRRLEEAT